MKIKRKEPHCALALICEDVRKEITGKDIIIGVLGDVVAATEFPVTIVAAIYLRFYCPQARRHDVIVAVKGEGGQIIKPQRLEIDTEAVDRFATLVLVGLPLTIKKPGDVNVFVSIDGDDEEWVTGFKLVAGSPRPDLAEMFRERDVRDL